MFTGQVEHKDAMLFIFGFGLDEKAFSAKQDPGWPQVYVKDQCSWGLEGESLDATSVIADR